MKTGNQKKVERIGVGGSAANPPHLGHLRLVELLCDSALFDRIIWIPSGVRPDKDGLILPEHRVRMIELLFLKDNKKIFDDRTKFEIDMGDVYGRNTPTINWMEKLQKKYPEAEIVWYTGVDSVVPQEKFGGKCEIEAYWHEGERLMSDFKFLIVPRSGFPGPADLDLPPQFEIFDAHTPEISSSEIRRLVSDGDEKFVGMTTAKVADYIKEKKLYGWKN